MRLALTHRHPAVFPTCVARPVSGLVSLGFPSSWIAPSQAISSTVAIANQANIRLTYRCGGSIGIVLIIKNAPISQFHPCLLKANQAPNNAEIITLNCKYSLNIF